MLLRTSGWMAWALRRRGQRGERSLLSKRAYRLIFERPELAWIGVESNQFGTDEFMKWCELVGTEPYLCLNMGTGTLEEGIYLRMPSVLENPRSNTH